MKLVIRFEDFSIRFERISRSAAPYDEIGGKSASFRDQTLSGLEIGQGDPRSDRSTVWP